jgi:hypothetical protein
MMRRLMLDARLHRLSRLVRLSSNTLYCRRHHLTSHQVKRSIVRDNARRYGLRVLVETGTYMGDMVWSALGSFALIYSVEIDSALAERARRVFASHPDVRILAGDSADVLGSILEELDHASLFWLDAHHSGGVTGGSNEYNPVVDEVSQILAHTRNHVILVDDARLFNGTDGYPRMDSLRDVITSLAPANQLEVIDDVIRIIPASVDWRAGGPAGSAPSR